MIKNNNYGCLEVLGSALGWLVAGVLWVWLTMFQAHASTALIEILPFITVSMLFATITGALGGYLAFGADTKWPPSSSSIGHILLGFGAGLFFTRGSLELLGYLNSSDDVVIFASFLWSAIGYFILRLLVSTVQSDSMAKFLPNWLIRLLGGTAK